MIQLCALVRIFMAFEKWSLIFLKVANEILFNFDIYKRDYFSLLKLLIESNYQILWISKISDSFKMKF
jgi:hypothetical protein